MICAVGMTTVLTVVGVELLVLETLCFGKVLADFAGCLTGVIAIAIFFCLFEFGKYLSNQ